MFEIDCPYLDWAISIVRKSVRTLLLKGEEDVGTQSQTSSSPCVFAYSLPAKRRSSALPVWGCTTRLGEAHRFANKHIQQWWLASLLVASQMRTIMTHSERHDPHRHDMPVLRVLRWAPGGRSTGESLVTTAATRSPMTVGSPGLWPHETLAPQCVRLI